MAGLITRDAANVSVPRDLFPNEATKRIWQGRFHINDRRAGVHEYSAARHIISMIVQSFVKRLRENVRQLWRTGSRLIIIGRLITTIVRTLDPSDSE